MVSPTILDQRVYPHHRTVAIVDDDIFNLQVLEAVVGQIDMCRIECFSSSAQALDWCLTNDPDLIIVDFNMPPPDGIAFISSIRRTLPLDHLPVVMCTSEKDRKVRHRALDAGASDFLNKPIDEIEILARVRNLLTVRASRLLIEGETRLLDAEVRSATAKLRAREKATIECLVRAAEFRDNETGSHIIRMGLITAIICETMGYSPEDAESMRVSAQMHDIGKVSIPDAILLKEGPLTEQEFGVMQSHTTAGYEILRKVDSPLLQQAAQIALSHHERFDGTGYPNGSRGQAIPLSGRIVALADVFDALLSERPYKAAWTLDRAVDFIELGRERHFDPDVVEAFESQLSNIVLARQRYRD